MSRYNYDDHKANESLKYILSMCHFGRTWRKKYQGRSQKCFLFTTLRMFLNQTLLDQNFSKYSFQNRSDVPPFLTKPMFFVQYNALNTTNQCFYFSETVSSLSLPFPVFFPLTTQERGTTYLPWESTSSVFQSVYTNPPSSTSYFATRHRSARCFYLRAFFSSSVST